jgi:serine O-acetyltransferase
MFENLLADLRHKAQLYELPPTSGSLLRMLVSDGSAAQLMYRAMRFCQTHHCRMLAAILYRLNGSITHATIGRNADMAPGFVILHSVGVVINSNVRAGRNLVIHHGVTLGEVRHKSPILGDNVYIGAGAKVIGGLRIGSHVRIGANAVVTKDVPDGATVVGIPARIVRMYGVPLKAAEDA